MAVLKQQPSWRERALAHSEIITDAWEVTKTYAGRIAEWVLFLCMVANIIEILVSVPVAFSNIVLGTQVVMLDVGGFSLASMADQAREQGDDKAAHRASITGYFLIAITILTLLLVTVGLLFSQVKNYTDGAEKALILVRVVMTVIYAHVIHSLRRASAGATAQRQQVQMQVEALAETLNQQMTHLHQRIADSERHMADLLHQVQAQHTQSWQETEAGIEQRMTSMIEPFAATFEQVKEQVFDAITQLQNARKPAAKTVVLAATKTAVLGEENRPVNEASTSGFSASEIVASWLSTGRKTVTFDEICSASNCTSRIVKNRIAKGLIKRSPRNPDLYRIESVLEWLKSEEKRSEPVQKPALLLVKSARQPEAVNE